MKQNKIMSLLIIQIMLMSLFSVYAFAQTAPQCTDSDNGLNQFTRGKAGGAPYGYDKQIGIIWGEEPNRCSARSDPNLKYSVAYDCCSDTSTNKQLNEALCENGLLQTRAVQCEFGCKDGACLKEPISQQETRCIDSDTNNDPYVKGQVTEISKYTNWQPNTFSDMCSDSPQGNLAEAVCETRADGSYGTQQYYNCPNGCENGVCIRRTTTTPSVMQIYTDKSEYAENEPVTIKTRMPTLMNCEDYFVSSSGQEFKRGYGGCPIDGFSYSGPAPGPGKWKAKVIAWYPEQYVILHPGTPTEKFTLYSDVFSVMPLAQPVPIDRVDGFHLKENEKNNFVLNGREYEVAVKSMVISENSKSVRLMVNGEITPELFAGNLYELADGTKLHILAIGASLTDVQASEVVFKFESRTPRTETSRIEKITDFEAIGAFYLDSGLSFTLNGMGYMLDALVISQPERIAKLTINGERIKIREGEKQRLANGAMFYLEEVLPTKVDFRLITTPPSVLPTVRCEARGSLKLTSEMEKCIGEPMSEEERRVVDDACDDVIFSDPAFKGCNDAQRTFETIECAKRKLPHTEQIINKCLSGESTRRCESREYLPIENERGETALGRCLEQAINDDLPEVRKCDNGVFKRMPEYSGCTDNQIAPLVLNCIKKEAPQFAQGIDMCLKQAEMPPQRDEGFQVCNVPISQPLLYAVGLNPDGICMGGELQDIIVPPAFVDPNTRPIPNLRPDGELDKNRRILSCKIPCSAQVKRTCLKDLGVTTQGANYEVNPVDRTRCGEQSSLPRPIPLPPVTLPPIVRPEECKGCEINNRCLQFGVRLIDENNAPAYCDWDKLFKPQKQNNAACQNSYECVSNTCADGKCQSVEERIKAVEEQLREQQTILQRMMDFFKRMFGG